ncbi:MAG: MFS transporter [Anaerolineae bacterium]|nr:MFS transporter [Anaerolineae bacterium]
MNNPNSIKSTKPPRLAALHYHDFRLLWLSQLIATIGSNMQLIAVNWHIYELLRPGDGPPVLAGMHGTTGDLLGWGRYVFVLPLLGEASFSAELGLGLLGLVRVFPILLFAMLGGMVADTHNRRTVMLWAQGGAVLFAVLLAWATFGGATVAVIYFLTAAGAAASAFDQPARQALAPNLVPREHLANAVSLNTVMWQVGTIVGPALAGVLIAGFDMGLVYAVNAILFLAAMLPLLVMRDRGRAAAQGVPFDRASMVEGLKFTYRSRIIWSTMLLDFFATFFASARTMLPIVAGEMLGVGAAGYGLLATAQPIGALIAGAALALRDKEIDRQGTVLLASVAVYGAATALFGLSTLFALSYGLFALTGAGDTVSTVIRGTIRQVMTPDHLRGRMVGVNMIFFMGGPQLGELEAGLVADAFGTPFAIFTGGAATVLLTAWLAWRYPRLRRYTRDTQEAYIGSATV